MIKFRTTGKEYVILSKTVSVVIFIANKIKVEMKKIKWKMKYILYK